jgi:hypothetical protein
VKERSWNKMSKMTGMNCEGNCQKKCNKDIQKRDSTERSPRKLNGQVNNDLDLHTAILASVSLNLAVISCTLDTFSFIRLSSALYVVHLVTCSFRNFLIESSALVYLQMRACEDACMRARVWAHARKSIEPRPAIQWEYGKSGYGSEV